MTHEGRMQRGKANFEANINLDNEDTKYYLENKKENPKPSKSLKKASGKKGEDVEDGRN